MKQILKNKKALFIILIVLILMLLAIISIVLINKNKPKKTLEEKVVPFSEQVITQINNLYEYLYLYYFTPKENPSYLSTKDEIKYYKANINKYSTIDDIEELITNTFLEPEKYLNNLYKNVNFVETKGSVFLYSLSPCKVDNKDNLTEYKIIKDESNVKDIEINDIKFIIKQSNNKWHIDSYEYTCVNS